MAASSREAKVVSIARGFAKRAETKAAFRISERYPQPVRDLLAGTHPRVNALMVNRGGNWEFFERLREEDGSTSILARVTLRELVAILNRSAGAGEEGERITMSPWPGFDLAILLRDGVPRYAAAFQPETSIYVAEETLPALARFFDDQLSSSTPRALE